MQIDRAAIFRFGKLADRTVDFAPGINIVYGKNEAGKTTLHAFLTAMLEGEALADCMHLAAAAGASCVASYDALSGLKTLEELRARIAGGWAKNQ